MDAATQWWLENTAQGRRLQRRILPASALGPRARREEQEERERRENEERSFLTRRRNG